VRRLHLGPHITPPIDFPRQEYVSKKLAQWRKFLITYVPNAYGALTSCRLVDCAFVTLQAFAQSRDLLLTLIGGVLH
jgi:hypothetical protein